MKIYLDFGYGFTDYTYAASANVKIEYQLFSDDLVSVINKAEFYIADNVVKQLLISSQNIKVQITENSSNIFTGVISQKMEVKAEPFVGQMKCTALDNLYYLDKKLTSDIRLANAYIYKSSDPNNSILSQLIGNIGTISSSDILTQVAVFQAEKGENIITIIDSLLKEYGYCIYTNGSGEYCTKKLMQTWTASQVLDVFTPLTIEKRDKDIEASKIDWDKVESKTNILLAEDTTGGNSTYRCYINLAQGNYYPAGSDTNDTYIEYKSSLGDIIWATSASLSTTNTGTLTKTFTNDYTRGKIKIYAQTAGIITKLQVRGNAYVRVAKNISISEQVANTNKIYEYTSKYIYDQTNADNLASWLSLFYYTSNIRYIFNSTANYSLGDCYYITNAELGISQKVVIQKKVLNTKNNMYNYTALAVSDFTLTSITTTTNYASTSTLGSDQTPTTGESFSSDDVMIANTESGGTYVDGYPKLFVETASNGQKYISEKIVDDNGVALGYGSFRCEWVEVMQGIKMSNINSSELQIKDIDGTDLAGVNAKYYKVEDKKFAELNANSERKVSTEELIATKSLVFGVEDETGNWVKHHTPILYDRKLTNTSYYLINIATKIPASTNTMIDITLKQHSLAEGFNQVSNLEARWTGYVYNATKNFVRARCYLKLGTANISNPIYSYFWVDGNGYVNLYLRCASKIFNSYHSYSEISFNNYHFAKKEYADNWTLTYADSITGYNQDWGVQPIVTEGDTWQYWSSSQLLTSESFTSATLIRRYFTLLKPCTVYAQINNGTNLSFMFITMISGGSVITDKRSGYLYTYANYLCPGRYYIDIGYSSSSNFTLYLYMTNANNYNYQGTFTPSHFLYNWSSSA